MNNNLQILIHMSRMFLLAQIEDILTMVMVIFRLDFVHFYPPVLKSYEGYLSNLSVCMCMCRGCMCMYVSVWFGFRFQVSFGKLMIAQHWCGKKWNLEYEIMASTFKIKDSYINLCISFSFFSFVFFFFQVQMIHISASLMANCVVFLNLVFVMVLKIVPMDLMNLIAKQANVSFMLSKLNLPGSASLPSWTLCP